MKSYFFAYGVLSLLLLSFSTAQAASEVTTELSASELIKRLKTGGHIIYLRHASTDLESIDTNLSNCTTQRNLSEKGKEEARQIGQAINRLKIPVGDIYSSPYCRCKETAELVFGKYEVDPDLQFSIKKDKEESEQLGQHLLVSMQKSDVRQHNDVFVGHTSNLRDGLGVFPKPEGVAVIFQKYGNKLKFLGMIKPEQWSIDLDR